MIDETHRQSYRDRHWQRGFVENPRPGTICHVVNSTSPRMGTCDHLLTPPDGFNKCSISGQKRQGHPSHRRLPVARLCQIGWLRIHGSWRVVPTMLSPPEVSILYKFEVIECYSSQSATAIEPIRLSRLKSLDFL